MQDTLGVHIKEARLVKVKRKLVAIIEAMAKKKSGVTRVELAYRE